MSDALKSSQDASAWRAHEFRQVGGGVARVDAPSIVIETSAALRVTLWLPARDGRVAVASDAGRLALHSNEPDESAALDVLRRHHGQLSIAQVLCAEGLVDLHRAVCRLRGVTAPRVGAREIAARAAVAASPECSRAMAMFCGLLGDLAGRVALTAGAAGGVFIAGALVSTFPDAFSRSPFRRRFEGSAGDARALRAVPTCVVVAEPRRAATRAPAANRRDVGVH